MFQHHGLWFLDGDTDQQKYITPGPDGSATYQLHKLEAALGFCRRFRLAVDVGAHVGLWSRILAQRFTSVVAFEPVPALCECFRRNVLAPNVELLNVALGTGPARRCWLRMRRSDTLTSRIVPSGYQEPGVELVEGWLADLDGYELPVLDFLKIDVEGFELPVLQGAIITLKRCRPVVIVEDKGHGPLHGLKPGAALRFLEDLGARKRWDRGGDYVFSWDEPA